MMLSLNPLDGTVCQVMSAGGQILFEGSLKRCEDWLDWMENNRPRPARRRETNSTKHDLKSDLRRGEVTSTWAGQIGGQRTGKQAVCGHGRNGGRAWETAGSVE